MGENIRKGSGYSWKESTAALGGSRREASGFVVDNLNTKKISEAENDYERVFTFPLWTEVVRKCELARASERKAGKPCYSPGRLDLP